MMALEALSGELDPILLLLADPRRGIVSKSKFIPTIAEMLDFCRSEHIRMAEAERAEAVLELKRTCVELSKPGLTEEERAERRVFVEKCRKQMFDAYDALELRKNSTANEAPSPQTFVQWEADIKARFASNPPRLSPEALRSAGVGERAA